MKKFHNVRELMKERKEVAELFAANKIVTSQLQIQNRELNGRLREQVALWESKEMMADERESEYKVLFGQVTSTQEKINAVLMEGMDERNELKQLHLDTSERDLEGMRSLHKRQHAFGVMEAEHMLPRLQELEQKLEVAVGNLEAFVSGLA